MDIAVGFYAATPEEIAVALKSARDCPFCGTSGSRVEIDHEVDPKRDTGIFFMRCGGCGASGPRVNHPKYTGLAWNSRA